jgi:hypothetical protein
MGELAVGIDIFANASSGSSVQPDELSLESDGTKYPNGLGVMFEAIEHLAKF